MIINPNHANKTEGSRPAAADLPAAAGGNYVSGSKASSIQDSVIPFAGEPNEHARDGFVLKCCHHVRKFSGNYTSNPQEQDNYVNAAAYRLCRRFRNGPPDLSGVRDLEAYVARCAWNVLHDVMRSEGRQTRRNRYISEASGALESAPGRELSPLAAAIRNEQAEKVREALSKLPESDRKIWRIFTFAVLLCVKSPPAFEYRWGLPKGAFTTHGFA